MCMPCPHKALSFRNSIVPELILAAILLWFLIPGAAQAQPGDGSGAEEPPDSAWNLGIALGRGGRSNPFIASDDMDIYAVLDLGWYGDRFFFDNGDLGMNLYESPRVSVNALLVFNNERNYFSYLSNGSSGLDLFSLRQIASISGTGEAGGLLPGVGAEVDIDDLSAAQLEDLIYRDLDTQLPERDFAVNTGLEFLYISRWGDFQAQLFTDVSTTHNGESAWFSWSYPWLTEKSEYTLTLGSEWKSRDLVSYYYGVTAEEELPGRPFYSGGSTTNGVIRFAASHELNRHWKLVTVVEREYLGRSIHHSPIINESYADTFFAGLYFQF